MFYRDIDRRTYVSYYHLSGSKTFQIDTNKPPVNWISILANEASFRLAVRLVVFYCTPWVQRIVSVPLGMLVKRALFYWRP
jgi:hypothetical protein